MWFRFGSCSASVVHACSVVGPGFGSGLVLVQMCDRVGSGLVQVWFRFGSGVVQVWFLFGLFVHALFRCWFKCGLGLIN